jgi:hypothetical protein
MESALSRLAVASQRAPGFRSFQILKRHDELRLRAFFLSFDFDQRRAYFGGGMSDPAIREYCETIDWENMTIIARSGPACIDAVVILASLPPAHTTAKMSLACLLSGNQAQVVEADRRPWASQPRAAGFAAGKPDRSVQLRACRDSSRCHNAKCRLAETPPRPPQTTTNHTGDDRAEILSARDAKGPIAQNY